MAWEDEEDENLTPLEQWERDNNTGMSAGICPNCGSKIFQSTYADFCKCGEQDYSY